MKKAFEFICLMGIFIPLIFLLSGSEKEKEKKPMSSAVVSRKEKTEKKPSHHFGEAYADIPKASPPLFISQPPVKIESSLDSVVRLTLTAKARRKPPIIPGKAKANKKTAIKYRLSFGQRKFLFRDVFGTTLAERCLEEGLDTAKYFNLLVSKSVQESGARPYLKNDSSSARGLFQTINATGISLCRELGIDPAHYDPYNPYQSIFLGVRYFKNNLKIFNGNLDWAILAHYTGPGAARDTVAIYGGVEKTPFVRAVRNIMRQPYEEPPSGAINEWRTYLAYRCEECTKKLEAYKAPSADVPVAIRETF
ncbi:MAG: lytic transglycosylase domain-containing protein [Patescibacteria group bacterium]